MLAVLGGGAWLIKHERDIGANAERLKAVAAQSKIDAAKADSTKAAALQLAQAANQQKVQAFALVAKQRADSVRQDSLFKATKHERDEAIRVLADSGATLPVVRNSLVQMVAQVQRDSVALAQTQAVASRTIAVLLTTIQADSVALSAEQQHSRSLEALNATIGKELALTRSQVPSSFGKVVRGVLLVAGAIELGRISAAKFP